MATRRTVLAAAVGSVGALAVSGVRPSSSVRAEGEVINVGEELNTATSLTRLTNVTNDEDVFWASSQGSGVGLTGASIDGVGVAGSSTSRDGVFGFSQSSAGIRGVSLTGDGVQGRSDHLNHSGVWGDNTTGGYGVSGSTGGGTLTAAVWGNNYAAAGAGGVGVKGSTAGGTAVFGFSGTGPIPPPKFKTGVYGYAAQDSSAKAVWGETSNGHAIHGRASASSGYAGYFAGKVYTTKWYELSEISAPSAPAGNKARLFVRDNGSGKTQLCVRFATGAVQVLATQP